MSLMPRGGGDIVAKLASEKGWEIVGKEIYRTGTTDYSVGLLKAKKENAEVILIWMDIPSCPSFCERCWILEYPWLFDSG